MPPEAAALAAISIRGLTMRYGRLTALNDLSLDVRSGEIFGFLGSNGAGKTTTIRVLLDLIRPTSGRASILGHDCQARGIDARAQVGYLPGELGFYGDMTGRATLDLLAGLACRGADRRRRAEIQERLGFPETDLDRKLREYSTGMKRKLGIIQAFEDDPPVLILDEPTEGLDPLMQEALYGLLADAKRRGRTVFMSSHVLSEVERVCDRIGLVRKGELVLLAAVGEVRKLAARRVRVTFASDVSAPELPPGHDAVSFEPRSWTMRVQGTLGALVKSLDGLPVLDLEVEEARIEDVVLRYYRGETE